MRDQHQKVQLSKNFIIALVIVTVLILLTPSIFLIKSIRRSNVEANNVALSLSQTLPNTSTRGMSGLGVLATNMQAATDKRTLNEAKNVLMQTINAAKAIIQNNYLSFDLVHKLSEHASSYAFEINNMNLNEVNQATENLQRLIKEAEENIKENMALEEAILLLQQLITHANNLIRHPRISPDNADALLKTVNDAQELKEKPNRTSSQITSFNERFVGEIERIETQIKENPYKTPEERHQEMLKQAKEDAQWFNDLSMQERLQIIEQAQATTPARTNVTTLTHEGRGLILELPNGFFLNIAHDNPDLIYLFLSPTNVQRAFLTTKDAQDAGLRDVLTANHLAQLIEAARQIVESEEE
ncbi:MAG: hypothetical protein LBV67_11250 [Streptococcaceae bacterium]|jgi:RNA polymerase-interacting CarD/CdnL/TRCF family regulator|nr:hypothetical protein [Streptococcaceae bacterium]